METLTVVMVNPDISCLCKNSVDPDQHASKEANWSGSALFVIKYVNLYQQPGSRFDWLKIRSGRGFLIYSTWQGLPLSILADDISIYFSYFPKKQDLTFYAIGLQWHAFQGQNLFCGKKLTIMISLSFAEFITRVVKVNQ